LRGWYNFGMLKELTVGTTNPGKVAQIKGALGPLGISVRGVEDKNLLPNVVEDGKTANENAHKKAIAYAAALNEVVLSMDNALYFDELPENQQPGLHVRRINGSDNRVSDSELLAHFVSVIKSLGGSTKGHWEFGVCVATPKGKCAETIIISPRVFIDQPSSNVVEGYPLESIQTDPATGKIISDMTQLEQDEFWQRAIGQQLQVFVSSLELD